MIKVSGHRIRPAEIEAPVTSHPSIAEARSDRNTRQNKRRVNINIRNFEN